MTKEYFPNFINSNVVSFPLISKAPNEVLSKYLPKLYSHPYPRKDLAISLKKLISENDDISMNHKKIKDIQIKNIIAPNNYRKVSI